MTVADRVLLATPDGLATRARIDAAVSEFCPKRQSHVDHIALVALKARARANPKTTRPPQQTSPETCAVADR